MDELQYQIDLLKALNQKLSAECNMYRTLVDTSSNAFFYYCYEEDSCQIMGDWGKFFDAQIKNYNDVIKLFPEVREEDVEPLRDAVYIEEKGLNYFSQEVCKKDGRQWIECEVNLVRDAYGKPLEKLIRFRDITKFKKQNEDLAYMAYYDSLTGLYNRNRFVQELMNWIRRAFAEKSTVSVAFININDFRKINDGIGVLVGDELLQQFGQFLKELCEDDTMICAHLNADAYCLAIYDPYGERTMQAVYQQIHERLEKPFVLTSGEVSITVSVGVAEYPEAASTALELIERAEIVMFKVKHNGQSGIRYFDAPVIHDFLQNALIERKLKNAVYEKEFLLYFQPQYDTQYKKMRGVEALIRWRDEEGRMISPGEFIPIAEKSSLIIGIGEWVMEKAISTLAKWKKQFGVSMIMSINISAVHFAQDGFAHRLIGLVKEYGVSPKEVELEITETVLVEDFSHIIRKLELLQQYGIQAAIDDFGTGYSSFSYLRSLPIQTIKIDKSFIDAMLKDKAGNIIVESIVDMVNRLGYETIAEGVEEQEQFDYLKKIGCEYIQGYLLGRPMAEEQLEELLEKRVWE
ncbi:MAG: bifunctional diguanylate cyclase/phosphodiesterase [Lachnospiraceae bacterium]|nr:bifunctional diguanylate cyclase/phosphodiesterase [Lachnospiraceae bacterium]